MQQIMLPELYCPFRPAINECAGVAHEGTVKWVRRFELLPDDALQAFRATDIGRLAGRTLPDLPQDELQLVSDWYAWLFLLDDRRDDSEIGKHPGELAEVDARFLDILEGADPSDHDEPLAHALCDLRERLRERLSSRGLDPVWMRQFIRAVKEHLDATLWEAANRARSSVPDLASYIRMRPLTGGLSIITELIEIIEGTHLPQEARDHTAVRRLTEASHNATCWANDILSLDKELEHGEVNNLVLVLGQAERLTLQRAVLRAAEMHEAEVRAFVELAARLPSFGTAVDFNLERYVCILRARMRGVLDWSYESGRYRAAEEE